MRNLHLLLHKPSLKIFRLIFVLFFATYFCFPAFSQNLPDRIRGYKVHKANVSVHADKTSLESAKKPKVLLDSFTIDLAGVSLTKTSWDALIAFTVFGQSGRVDFISFQSFQINGTAVEIEEYQHRFKFKRGRKVSLVKPLSMSIGNLSGFRVAVRKLFDQEKEWRVQGKILVFGKFKKSFFRFKRVVPVDIDIVLKNPFDKQKRKD